jgi:hypothetical protein
MAVDENTTSDILLPLLLIVSLIILILALIIIYIPRIFQ